MCHTQRAGWRRGPSILHTRILTYTTLAGAHYNMDHTSFRVCARGVSAWNSRPPFLIDSSLGRDYYGIAADRATRMLMSRKLLWRAPFSPRRARNHRAADSDDEIRFAHQAVRPQIAPIIWGVLARRYSVPDPTCAGTGDFTFFNWLNEWLRSF